MTILVITDMVPKWAGHQSLARTLNGMTAGGHTVHVLRVGPPIDCYDGFANVDPSVVFHHRKLIPSPLRPFWVLVRTALRNLERLKVRWERRQPCVEGRVFVRPLVTSAGYWPAWPEDNTFRLVSKIAHLAFLAVGLVNGLWLSRRLKPDLVYGTEAGGALVAFLVGRICRRPVVTRFFGVGSLYRLVQTRRTWPKLVFAEKLLAARLSADLTVVTNDGTRGEEALRELSGKQRRILSLTNGVDFNTTVAEHDCQTLRSQLSIQSTTRVLMTVSGLAYWKRVDRAILGLPRIIQAVPDTVLVIVGDGSQKENLQALTRALRVAEYVRFCGPISHSRIYTFLRIADIFLNLHDLSNRMNSVLEAMACARCIVTLDDGSIEDLIVNGETGIILDPDTVEAELPAAVIALLDDAALRRRLGAAARARVEQHVMSVEERMRVEVKALERLLADS